MVFQNVIPILTCTNILHSVEYYTKVLGFERHWLWGDPPDFAGVSKDGVEIFLALNAQGGPGAWLSIFVNNVDEMYELIKSRGAKIISAPQAMEWGVREMLVEDPDGHKIRFGHGVGGKHTKSKPELPSSIVVHQRKPTAEEYRKLIGSVGWSHKEMHTEKILAAALIGFVAEDTISGVVVGCALILGDDISFYYVKDVMVDPAWQSKQVGTAVMKSVNNWLDKNGEPNALVGLYTGESLAPFYKQFGFREAYGMQKRVTGGGRS